MKRPRECRAYTYGIKNHPVGWYFGAGRSTFVRSSGSRVSVYSPALTGCVGELPSSFALSAERPG